MSAVAFTLDLRIWLLAFGTFAIGTDVFVVPGILPTIASDLNVSLDSAGQLVSAYALTYALGSPVFAAATARIRRDRLVFCALLGFAAADMFCALSSSYMALLAARVAAGVAAALYTPTAYALATAAAPPGQKGAALSAVALGLTTSFVVGVPLGVMVGQTLGWHATFWFVATLSVVAAGALAWGRLSSEVEAEPQPGLLARLAPLGRRRVLHILGPGLLWSTASSTVYTYVASFMGHYGYGTGAIASLLSLFGLGALSGSQLGGRLADRFGPERPIAICLGLAVLNQALLPWTMEAAPAAGASMFIWSFCAWATWAPQQSRLIAVEPAGKTVVIALSSSVVYLASALGATLGGLLLPVLLVTRLPIVGAMLYALALLLFLVSCRTVPPPPVEA